MAGQQDLKNYTRLWNPILEAMTKAKLTPNQYKICLALFQHTYTWRKKEARIGYRDFEKYTGIKAKKIGQPFRQLIERRVIIEVEKPSFNSPGLYKFNKDIRQWSPEVIDINQITETNLSIVMEECEGTVPIKGTPPKEGGTPPNKGEGSPQNGGEGTPHEGDTKQASNPCGSSDSGTPKESIKEIYKEKRKSIKDNSTLVATEQNKGSPVKKLSSKEFLNLENYHKVKYLETRPQNEQIGLCVIAYNHEFPRQAEKFGTGGAVTARKVFEEAVKKHHVPPEKLLVEILWNQEEGEPTPWELVDCLKGQRGLESTWAHVMYDIERYDREVGIKTYGPVDAQGPSP